MFSGDSMNRVLVCEKFWARFKGLMFESDNNTVLIFPRCNSIHTFFMRKPIDVYMVSMKKEILYFYPSVKRNKIILPKKEVFFTIEGPVGFDIDYIIDNYI
ncbi:MAG: DUF192 domain-containing protein [Bacilli bacterium]|jgi:hypothetical protein|nr:DUF192 domain-containing protein [Bacilli bacterium]